LTPYVHTPPSILTLLDASTESLSSSETPADPELTSTGTTTTTAATVSLPPPTPMKSTSKNGSSSSGGISRTLRSRKNYKTSSPMRHIAVVSPPNCNGKEIDDNNENNNTMSNSNNIGPKLGPEPSTRVVPGCTTTSTTTISQRNATSAFVEYASCDQMDVDHTTIPTSPIKMILDQSQGNRTDTEKSDNMFHGCYTKLDKFNEENFSDLLCMEEILSLSDSNHSHRSFITNASTHCYDQPDNDDADYDNADDTITTMLCDSNFDVSSFLG
jgi:hypothetical protein